jgi:hypothetical protein
MSQKNFIKEDFKILSTLSFVAKSWHIGFEVDTFFTTKS